jgi:hypothetical protein
MIHTRRGAGSWSRFGAGDGADLPEAGPRLAGQGDRRAGPGYTDRGSHNPGRTEGARGCQNSAERRLCAACRRHAHCLMQ